jgi:stage V sporulation protein SpoVS
MAPPITVPPEPTNEEIGKEMGLEVEKVEHIMKIKRDSNPFFVAGAVAGRIREKVPVGVCGIGADAVRSMVKCVAAVSDYVEKDGLNITAVPRFDKATIDGTEIQLVTIDIFPEPRA